MMFGCRKGGEAQVRTDRANTRELPSLGDGDRSIVLTAAPLISKSRAHLPPVPARHGGNEELTEAPTDPSVPSGGVWHASRYSDVCLMADLKNTREIQCRQRVFGMRASLRNLDVRVSGRGQEAPIEIPDGGYTLSANRRYAT
jgi:hypothetical protein